MKQWITAKLFPLSLPSLLLALIISASVAGSLYLHLFLMQPIGRRRLAFLMLMMTSLLLGTYLVIRLLILPVFGRLRKGQLAFALAGSLMSGLYLFTFSPWKTPVLYVSSNQLEISVDDEKNPLSGGTAVELLGFSAEGQFISFSDFSIEGDWRRIGDRMVANGTQPARLRWEGIAREIILIFKTSPESGVVRIRYDGKEQIYDLYSPSPDQLYVHEQSSVSLPGTRLPAIILNAIPLAFLTLSGLCVMLIAWPGFTVDKHPNTSEFIPVRNRRLPFVFGLSGSALLFVVSRQFGLWIVGDSVNYISAARHLIAGDGYIALNSDVFDWWPPLYPTLLAPFQFFSFFESLIGIRWLHALLLGAIIYCTGILTQHLLTSCSQW